MKRPEPRVGAVRTVRSGLVLAAQLLSLLSPSTLAAQDPGHAADFGTPGAFERPSGERLTGGEWSYRMRLRRDGRERELGTYRVSVHRASVVNGRAWLVVQRTDRAGSTSATIDSAWLEPETLRPIRQVSHSPRGSLILDFRDGEVRGERRMPDGTVREIEAEPATTLYSASVVGVLIQALRLKQGFQVELPLYDDRQGVVPGRIRVLGSEPVELADGTTVDAWVVSVAVGRLSAIRWVHKTSGVGIRTESELSTGDGFAQEITATPAKGPEG